MIADRRVESNMSTTESGFRGPHVCTIVGITYRQLDYWARTGLLRPSIADAHGSGSQRIYSYQDLLKLKVIKGLLDSGVSLQATRQAIDILHRSLGGDLAAASLVLSGDRSILARTGDEIVDLLAGGQGVFNIVPLGGIVREVDAAIHDFSAAKSRSSGASAVRSTVSHQPLHDASAPTGTI
jgi:DNA-binding transcriptional MerR regulator